ncbi:MAG: hypothetical protein NTW61_10005 [Candidatus Melainabacteria bacterium]|jgi:hypothetical protein|nr:hypothetical protein [Candidatus Melainabacteria bacterium]
MDLLKGTGGVIFHEALNRVMVFSEKDSKYITAQGAIDKADPKLATEIYAEGQAKHNILKKKGTALLISEEAGVNTPFVQAFIDNLLKYAKAVDFKQFGVTHKAPKSDDKLFLKITKTPQEPKVLEQLGWEQVEGTETDYILNLRKQQDQVRAIAEKFINPTDDFSTIDYPALMEQLFAPFHSAIEPLLSETQKKTEFAEFVIKPQMLSPIISENLNEHLNKTHGFPGGYAGGYGYEEVVPVY